MPDNYGIGTAIGAGMGLLLEGHNDRRQVDQQRRLQNLQIQGQQQMGDYNYGKQLQFWKDTNYQAQMEQMKMAGLNPALMYKQGGSGGMTIGAPGGNVTGGNAPAGGMEIMNMIAQKAAIELTKAQTEKTKAETGAVAPTIEKTQAETKSITQGINNQIAQQKLTEVQTGIASIAEHIAGATQNTQVAMVETQLRSITAAWHILENDKTISDATVKTKIGILKQELALQVLEGWKKKAETINIDQQTRESINRVALSIQENLRKWYDQGIQMGQQQINAGMWDDTGLPKELQDVLEIIGIGAILRGGKTGPAPITGFHKR